MLNVMQVVKDEVVTDVFVRQLKEFVEKVEQADGIIAFVCNTNLATRMLTTFPASMPIETVHGFIKNVARQFDADALVTIKPRGDVDGQLCLAIGIDTLLERSDVFYPYERVDGKVSWKEPITTDLGGDNRFAELLPTPAGMAQA